MSQQDRRFDFGVSLSTIWCRCVACGKNTRNRGDKFTQQVYCAPCFNAKFPDDPLAAPPPAAMGAKLFRSALEPAPQSMGTKLSRTVEAFGQWIDEAIQPGPAPGAGGGYGTLAANSSDRQAPTPNITFCNHCQNQATSANPCDFCKRDWRFAPADPVLLVRRRVMCDGKGRLGGCSNCGLDTSVFADPSQRPGFTCATCNGKGKFGGCFKCGLDTSALADASVRVGKCTFCSGKGRLGGCQHCGINTSVFAEASQRPGFACGICGGKGKFGGCHHCGLDTSVFASVSKRPDSVCGWCHGKGKFGGCTKCGLDSSPLASFGGGMKMSSMSGGGSKKAGSKKAGGSCIHCKGKGSFGGCMFCGAKK